MFSNLAITLDGKIAPANRSFFPLGTAEDLRLLEELRADADAVLFGASTLRTFRRPCKAKLTKKNSTPRSRPSSRVTAKQPMNIVVSSCLDGIDPNWPFFSEAGFYRVLLVDKACPADRFKLFSKSSKVIRVEDSTPSVAEAWIEIARSLGVKRLLVEGGGGVMWEFVRRNLIDQYYVTLTPRLLGGATAPTLVDGAGLSEKDLIDLKLTQCKRVGDELYLIYSKTHKSDG